MSWWAVYAVLFALHLICTAAFIPAAYRRNYVRCPKDATCWAALLLQHSIWIMAAIQQAVSPEETPLFHHLGGVVFFTLGNALLIWARAVNPLFLPLLVYVEPRLRITTGPYRITNDPGYLGLALAAHGTFLILGQWWAVWPMGLYQGLLLRRTILERRLLSQ